MTAISYRKLRRRGFRVDSSHLDSRPHMVYVLNGDISALEIAESISPRGEWAVWLRSDVAHSRCRFVFVRHVQSMEQLSAIALAISDRDLPYLDYDVATFDAVIDSERKECLCRYEQACVNERFFRVPG